MASANEQLDLFTRKRMPCLICERPFWGWPNDKKCILCRSPMEDALSIDHTYDRMIEEQEIDDQKG